MKWMALVLASINAVLWYYGTTVSDASHSIAQAQGTLPRVATLKTVDDAIEPVEQMESVDEPVESVDPVPVLYCARLGWFETEEEALAEMQSLAPGGEQVEVEQHERARSPLHWVLIPPQPPAQAREAFRDIQSRGIDSYLVTEGENSFAISLGLFESRASALAVLEEKKRQNLNAVLAIFPRNQISYALVFEAGHFRDSEEVRAAEADYRKNFDLVEIRPCEGVATP
ncbi:MAG: hypothetical protein ACQEV6_14820 [Pseudomonadota bacterium]